MLLLLLLLLRLSAKERVSRGLPEEPSPCRGRRLRAKEATTKARGSRSGRLSKGASSSEQAPSLRGLLLLLLLLTESCGVNKMM